MTCGSQVSLGTKPFSNNLDHYLKLYASAAVAAGVGILALATPAEGKVVVTNTNISFSPGSFTYLDMNNDGIKDFAFGGSLGGYGDHTWYGSLAVFPIAGGKIVGGARKPVGPYGSALTSGAKVGPSAHFSSSVAQGQLTLEFSGAVESGPSFYYHSLRGPWGYVGSRYLGVRFLISGQIHYGWIRMSVGWSHRAFGNITEYAYETTANKAITAGATSDSTDDSGSTGTNANQLFKTGPSLGALALGTDGLPAWRRREDELGKD
jgi:hypothetical protein